MDERVKQVHVAAGVCGLCQQWFSARESLVQAMEDRHPACHKEIVSHACHRSCSDNCETGDREVAGGSTF